MGTRHNNNILINFCHVILFNSLVKKALNQRFSFFNLKIINCKTLENIEKWLCSGKLTKACGLGGLLKVHSIELKALLNKV